MFVKNNFNANNFDVELVDAIGNRLENNQFSDAILAGTKYLTTLLREKGQCEGDGAQLVGTVLGGQSPRIKINSLQSVSEQDEQRGFESLLRGYYQCIRNPRTHDNFPDTEDSCMRILIMLDTLIKYLKRDVAEFDYTAILERVYEVHFVNNSDYAEALISQIPEKRLVDFFQDLILRFNERPTKEIDSIFKAINQRLSGEEEKAAMRLIGEELRRASNDSEFANVFRIIKPSAWRILPDDVLIRMEKIIIEECKKGYFDFYSNATKGAIGTWGNTFGSKFKRKDDLGDALIGLLYNSWYTQNYVAKYYVFSIPSIITDDVKVKELADALAYATIVNGAKLLRTKLIDASKNYPEQLKNHLRDAVQQRMDSDKKYAEELLDQIG
ncbi:TIGR02391 family protein [Klebsiella pneumoniae]|uniref:TIGR02391 family protein n=1 Tax=Klebsiella pneumoniae TaxID=573 RepID=UPI00350FC21D